MTTISTPRADEYAFQYKEPPRSPLIPVSQIIDFFQEFKEVSVKGKVFGLGEPYVPGKELKLCKGFFSDGTGTIQIDVWENYIQNIRNGHVYSLSPVLLRSWQGVKKITTIKAKTVVKELENEQDLEQLEEETDLAPPDDDKQTISIPEIHSIDKIETFIKCSKCSKKILQAKSSLVHCDFCGQHARASNCTKDVCVKILIMDGEQTVQLTAFGNVLKSAIPGILDTNDDNDIAEKLLILTDIELAYDNRSKIISELRMNTPHGSSV
ncbi:hypothetical protein QZH41_002906 [Actinostola sp. cb2023]|nr:hypothetical protein QZH41_002906 [Actinostola sp. cb2023]